MFKTFRSDTNQASSDSALVCRVHPQSMSSQGRHLQVQCAKAAVEQAIVRRVLAKAFRLDVSPDAKFSLHRV